jgi:RNA polymerase II subunit A small phosphatase-like protein
MALSIHPTSPPTRKLLVLDLDETLIHATAVPLERAADFTVEAYHVYKRPHLASFLRYALATFDVGVWTSAGENYARQVLDRLALSQALRFIWTSQRCTTRRHAVTGDSVELKRLAKLKSMGYALEHIIAVDDSPQKHRDNHGNLVHIPEFIGDPADFELLLLQDYLGGLVLEPNIRRIEKRGWRDRMLEARQAPPARLS